MEVDVIIGPYDWTDAKLFTNELSSAYLKTNHSSLGNSALAHLRPSYSIIYLLFIHASNDDGYMMFGQ